MKKTQLAFCRGYCGLASFALLLFAACADTYDADETFSGGVRNAQLSSPAEADITITPSTDGSSQTISWPVVYGAGGYELHLVNAGNESLIMADTIDGCSVTVPREDDVNYRLELRTLGNAKLNNRDAAETTMKSFSTFTASFAAIPEGDLYTWFVQNPIPDDSIGINLNYDLAAGGHYTLSHDLDFGLHIVTLRSTSKENHATITFDGDYTIQSATGMSMKYLDFDCSKAVKSPVFELSPTPPDTIKGITGKGDYYNIMYAWTINSCNFEGVNYQLIYDNNEKYCLETLMITNCNIHMTTDPETGINGNAFIYFKLGYANTTIVQYCTFWNTGEGAAKYFLQHGNNNRCDRAGYVSNLVSYVKNTFYNLNCQQWSNYSGFSGRATSQWVCTGNIFYECGPQVARRILGGRSADTYSSTSFSNNTYWVEGEPETGQDSYDTGFQLTTDPAFVDPAHGNFTPTGAEQVERKTGDPRWFND